MLREDRCSIVLGVAFSGLRRQSCLAANGTLALVGNAVAIPLD